MSRKPRTNQKVYFTEETEKAIILYNKTTDPDERNRIFKEHIQYPLDKLSENIINRFKFPYVNQSYEDMKRQVVSFLVINLEKFVEGKGKAFSYFSIIAKHYLILHNTNGWKQEKREIYLSDKTDSDVSIEDVLQLESPSLSDADDTKEFVKIMVEYWDKNLHTIFKKKRDIDIAKAVLYLFSRSNTIENYNKKALYVMIRGQIDDVETGYITKVVNKMKQHVQQQRKEFNYSGLLHKPDDTDSK